MALKVGAKKGGSREPGPVGPRRVGAKKGGGQEPGKEKGGGPWELKMLRFFSFSHPFFNKKECPLFWRTKFYEHTSRGRKQIGRREKSEILGGSADSSPAEDGPAKEVPAEGGPADPAENKPDPAGKTPDPAQKQPG